MGRENSLRRGKISCGEGRFLVGREKFLCGGNSSCGRENSLKEGKKGREKSSGNRKVRVGREKWKKINNSCWKGIFLGVGESSSGEENFRVGREKSL